MKRMKAWFEFTADKIETYESEIQIAIEKGDTRKMREYKIDNCCDFAAFIGLLDKMLEAGEIYAYNYDKLMGSVRVYFYKEALKI